MSVGKLCSLIENNADHIPVYITVALGTAILMYSETDDPNAILPLTKVGIGSDNVIIFNQAPIEETAQLGLQVLLRPVYCIEG
jgi:hypothetical protein